MTTIDAVLLFLVVCLIVDRVRLAGQIAWWHLEDSRRRIYGDDDE